MVKVFNYPWHIAHQYELVRIPDTKWSWLQQSRRSYSAFPRGDYFDKYGMEWVPDYEPGKYDLALLHLDQQCLEEALWERGKGSLFRELNEVITDVPKVCIMHGTPYYPEAFQPDITEENYKSLGRTSDQIGMSSVLIDKFIKAIEDIDVVIFNSYTAQKQWMGSDTLYRDTGKKTQKCVTIWHGMDADEWWDLPKEPRVVTMISPAGLDMYYDRTLLRTVKEMLQDKDIIHCHITTDAVFKSFDEYRNFLGRSLLYFNPTRQSPMPRSRTEAMLSGCCVISIGGQDVESVIETGENGIIVPRSPQFIVDLIETLIYDYKKAVELGKKGKETAKEKFSLTRFHDQWQGEVISYALKK